MEMKFKILSIVCILYPSNLLFADKADSLQFPLDNYKKNISQKFQNPNNDFYGAFHLGEDINIAKDTPVFAIGNGTI